MRASISTRCPYSRGCSERSAPSSMGRLTRARAPGSSSNVNCCRPGESTVGSTTQPLSMTVSRDPASICGRGPGRCQALAKAPVKSSAKSRQHRRSRGVENRASSTSTATGQAASERENVSARPSKMPDTIAATGRIRGSVAADLASTQASSPEAGKFSA